MKARIKGQKMKRKLNKIAYAKEPVLHIHRYVVAVHTSGGEFMQTKYQYCRNLKEVREHSLKQAKGTVIEVYRAAHNFIVAYEG